MAWSEIVCWTIIYNKGYSTHIRLLDRFYNKKMNNFFLHDQLPAHLNHRTSVIGGWTQGRPSNGNASVVQRSPQEPDRAMIIPTKLHKVSWFSNNNKRYSYWIVFVLCNLICSTLFLLYVSTKVILYVKNSFKMLNCC